jgi:hypothetical protein
MFKKISAFLFCGLFSVGAWAALPVTNGSNVNVNGAAVSTTNPLPALGYGLNGSTLVPLNIIKTGGGTTELAVGIPALTQMSVPTVLGSTGSYGINIMNTQGTFQQAAIAAGATVATLTPPANNALAMWGISITGDATLATAGEDTITVALNGVTLYQTSVYIPATALSAPGQYYSRVHKYNSFVVPKVGASGTFTVTLGTALATGMVNVNIASGN